MGPIGDRIGRIARGSGNKRHGLHWSAAAEAFNARERRVPKSIGYGDEYDEYDEYDEDTNSTDGFELEGYFAPEPSETGTSASVFEKARQYIETGWFFRKVTYMYAERKTLLCFFVHFAVTLVIFVHFFSVKFNERKMEVEEGENRYWWKRLAPTTEFALAHTMLLQMTLLPLTMSRLSIVMAAENSLLAKLIPFNRMVRFHICLGYNMILTTCAAVAVSVTYISLVCSDGEAKFCSKFSSEIMVTGYFMLGMLLTVLISSYLRHVIPYRIFYAIHHLVFAMYLLTAVHTFDRVQRQHERERSQTFKWFSAAVLYYICDRAAMAMNHSYRTTVVSSSVVASTDSDEAGSKMVIIKLLRPPLFRAYPGQYAFLRIPDIDNEYHPFSIASSPDSEYVEFYIEVFKPGSWTHKLWNLMDEPAKIQRESLGRRILVDLMGPYGTSLGNTNEYSHAIGIGSGTGIVPMMALLKQHVQQLLRLDAEQHFKTQERHHKNIYKLYKVSRRRMGSVSDKVLELICGRRLDDDLQDEGWSHNNKSSNRSSVAANLKALTNPNDERVDRRYTLREVKREARRATIPIYGTVALLLVPPFGVACLGFTFSFTAIGAPYPWMKFVLHVGTVVFHELFGFMALFAEDVSEFKTFIDIAFLVIACFADWYFYARDLWSRFSSTDVIYYSLLNAYMVLSVWYNAVKSRRPNWRNQVAVDGIKTMDKVKFVWVTRSAGLVSKLYPDIAQLWTSLRDAWGEEATNEVCEIAIYVTDRDKEACAILREELGESPLYHSGAVKFERPNFAEMIESHTIELITDPRVKTSSTLLAFCGNPNLSVMVNQAKISNDISTVITDHNLHTMEFVSESYGGASKGGGGGGKKKSKKKKGNSSDGPPPLSMSQESNSGIPNLALPESPIVTWGASAEREKERERKKALSRRRFKMHDVSLAENEIPFPSQGALFGSTDDEDDEDKEFAMQHAEQTLRSVTPKTYMTHLPLEESGLGAGDDSTTGQDANLMNHDVFAKNDSTVQAFRRRDALL